MITIQILVAAVAVAAILTSVIVHVVDKKHSASEVIRLNARITKLEEETVANEQKIKQLKELAANAANAVYVKPFDGPLSVSDAEVITDNAFIQPEGDDKYVMYVSKNITGTDNQLVVLKDKKQPAPDRVNVRLFLYVGSYNGKSVTPDEKNK